MTSESNPLWVYTVFLKIAMSRGDRSPLTQSVRDRLSPGLEGLSPTGETIQKELTTGKPPPTWLFLIFSSLRPLTLQAQSR